MREEGLGEGENGSMALQLTVVELVHVKDKLLKICVVQLVGNRDGSWDKIEWGEECGSLSGKVTLPCVCVLTAKWAVGSSPAHGIMRHTYDSAEQVLQCLLRHVITHFATLLNCCVHEYFRSDRYLIIDKAVVFAAFKKCCVDY